MTEPTTPLIPEHLERGRLIYERMGPEHGDDYARLMAEPRVLETLWPWPTPPSAADRRAALRLYADHWERHGFGLWALRDATSQEFVGRGGLEYTDIDGQPMVEVAWAVMPARWGQGLASELAQTSVQIAFEVLELEQLIAITLPDNVASRRVMEKADFAYEREVEHAGLPHVLYVRRRARC